MAYDDQEDLFGEDFDFVDEDELDEMDDESSALEDSKLEDSKLDDSKLDDSDLDDSELDDSVLDDSELDDSELDDQDATKKEAPVAPAQDRSNKKQEPAAVAEDQKEKPPSRGKRHSRRGKSASTARDSKQADRPHSSQEQSSVNSSDGATEPENQDADGNREAAEVVPEGPPADHVVHIYELRKFKRTIQREFTAEDAEAFAVEYNRTSKTYNRLAMAVSREEDPAPTV